MRSQKKKHNLPSHNISVGFKQKGLMEFSPHKPFYRFVEPIYYKIS
jgi:hypothetical protein